MEASGARGWRCQCPSSLFPPHHAIAGPEGPPQGRSEGVLGHLAGWKPAPGPRLLPRHHAIRGGVLSEPLWLQRPCPPGFRLPEPPGWLRCGRGLPGRWGQTWALTQALCALPGTRGGQRGSSSTRAMRQGPGGSLAPLVRARAHCSGKPGTVGRLGAGTCQGAPPWHPVPSR